MSSLNYIIDIDNLLLYSLPPLKSRTYLVSFPSGLYEFLNEKCYFFTNMPAEHQQRHMQNKFLIVACVLVLGLQVYFPSTNSFNKKYKHKKATLTQHLTCQEELLSVPVLNIVEKGNPQILELNSNTTNTTIICLSQNFNPIMHFTKNNSSFLLNFPNPFTSPKSGLSTNQIRFILFIFAVLKAVKDSILTKKSRVVNAMKSGLLFEQAKSIMSHESLQSEAMQIEQSIIVSRSMDYFCHITAERELGVCKAYLGVDCEVGLLVGIRLFQHRFQHLSFNEAELYNHLGIMADTTGISFGVLELYKTLVEGTGEHKNIYFVLQPYEQIMDSFIEKRRAQFRSVLFYS